LNQQRLDEFVYPGHKGLISNCKISYKFCYDKLPINELFL